MTSLCRGKLQDDRDLGQLGDQISQKLVDSSKCVQATINQRFFVNQQIKSHTGKEPQ